MITATHDPPRRPTRRRRAPRGRCLCGVPAPARRARHHLAALLLGHRGRRRPRPAGASARRSEQRVRDHAGVTAAPGPADVDRSDPAGRAWVDRAVAAVEADARRSADTHLLVYPLPPEWGVELYLKDESTHPTGSLKHRLARSLFLYGLCSGQITEGSTVVEASSGSTAVSEAYFARMLGLPFVAVMPAATSPEKIALIEFHGGRCHLVDDAGTVYDEARRIAAETGGHYLDQFTNAERATDWRGQQQHRRVDLQPAGAGASTRCRSGSSSAPAPAARARPSAATCATGGCPPGWRSSTRRARRSSPAGGTATRRRRPDGRRGSRASAGRGSSRRSCRRSSTG